ncbi:MAG: cyclic nucleotide-binding domain-containing protein [Gemmatimonadota bacterium]|nr:cyclic nucleotide-binding domain-containing protein [Gemmatimonadota bacterium]
MDSETSNTVPPDVLESLRSNPVLASISDEALNRIGELVVEETRAQVGSALKQVELFDGLPEEDFERLRTIAEPVILEADTRLFEEGEPGDYFYVVVRGSVELTKGGEDGERLAVLRAGQAFGEMALLNEAPRSATAHVPEQSYLIGISRDAFFGLLDSDSLAARLLKNLSKALWATSVRLAHKDAPRETPREALSEYNRMVRGRLLPRGTPNFPGFDVAGSTVAHEHGEGAAAWDWFLLSDGRLALAVLKADQVSLSSAHRLLSVRGLLRDFAEDPLPDLGALLARVNRGLRAGWVEGISGAVSCGLAALSEDGVEWASAGGVGGTVVRANGAHEDLVPDAPALGSDDELEYRSVRLSLGEGDHLLAFAEGPSDSVILGRKFLAEGGTFASARARLDALVARVRESDAGVEGVFDITATLVTRAGAAEGEDRSGSDVIAKAAAAFDASLDPDGASRSG